MERLLSRRPSTQCRATSSTSSFRALWAALDATYYAGGRTTIDGEKGEQFWGTLRLGLTAALSLSRHQSIKVYGSTGVYSRTDSNFWAVRMAG